MMVKKRRKKTKESVKDFIKEKKLNIALKNLLFFAVLYVVFTAISLVASNELFGNLFSLLAMISGYVALAFLIVTLIFVFLKLMKKK